MSGFRRSHATTGKSGGSQPAQVIQSQIEQLAYLPGSAAVAIKFIELGKDADAGPVEYDRVISSDAALSAKLLSLANSSWYATRQEVTTVLRAVNLLGINNVRTLAISYCMAGLHNRIKMPKEVLNRYWLGSLTKGVAAKAYAAAFDRNVEDEAFTAALFQDMALPVIHSAVENDYAPMINKSQLEGQALLAAERELLGIDHTEVGRLLATKLELPESYIDAIAFHHDSDCLHKFVESSALAGAIEVAAIFPHLPDQWHPSDAEALTTFLAANAAVHFPTRESFVEAAQETFDSIYRFFQTDGSPALQLNGLIADACSELADATSVMVGQMNSLMNEAAKMGAAVSELAAKHEKLDDERKHDSLTYALNRVGFMAAAETSIEQAARDGKNFALCYFDVDRFKSTNDAHGHQFGDYVLRETCDRIAPVLRDEDFIGRIGGDEFVIFLTDTDAEKARQVSDAIMKAIRYEPYVSGRTAIEKTVSLGVLCVSPEQANCSLGALIQEADSLMYMAKRSGPGQVRMRQFSGAAVE